MQMPRFAFLAIAATFAVACSSSPTQTTPPPEEDASSEDTSTEDASDAAEESSADTASDADDSTTDSTVADTGDDASSDGTADTADVSTTCTETGAVETESCGKCGKRARLCDSGKWLPWGVCTGEKGTCAPGDTRSVTCGKCGKRTETCNATCEYEPGACTGEGLCNAGDTEVQYGVCSIAKQVKVRTCSATTCTWSDWSACTAPKGWQDMAPAPSTFSGRQYHTAVWTGTEMVVWGGQSYSSTYANDGAAYNPTTDSWRTLTTPSITGRHQHTAVWTGSAMIVWGGYGTYVSPYYQKNDGASWNPSTNTWTTITATGAPSHRYQHTAVWSTTTNEMIIWGGSSVSSSYANDGAAYSPAKNEWRTIAAAPIAGRRLHNAVWVGSKMIVFGGQGSGTNCSSTYCSDGAAYDPVTNTWTTLSPPSEIDGRYWAASAVSGSSAFFWGGYGTYVSPTNYKSNGAIFNAATSTWKAVPSPADTILPSARRYSAVAWSDGTQYFVWGGYGYPGSYQGNGAIYTPASDTWVAMSDTNAPSRRYLATVVWTGSEAIVWGGTGDYVSPTSYKNDGKIFRP